MRLSAFGEIVEESWRWLASQNVHVTLDEWRVMPNHVHGILVLTTAVAPGETRGAAGTDDSFRKPLGRLVGAFKTRSTNRVNRMRGTPGAVIWQRNFWDRVIRDDDELRRIREYIRGNVAAYRPRTFTL